MNHVYGPMKYVDRWFAVLPWIACIAGGISVGVLFLAAESREECLQESLATLPGGTLVEKKPFLVIKNSIFLSPKSCLALQESLRTRIPQATQADSAILRSTNPDMYRSITRARHKRLTTRLEQLKISSGQLSLGS